MQGYDSNIPDIVLDKSGNILKKIVKVSTTIKEIQNIAEVQSRFTTTFNLKLEWIDTRLIWYDLNDDLDLNIPSKVHKKSIWFPKILITNSQDNTEVPNDSKSKIRVRKSGNLTMSSKENLKESALYSGKENYIVFSRRFTEELNCVFDLSFFPFDTQTCSIYLNVGNEERYLVELIGDNVDYIGNQRLSTFDVIECELENDDTADDVDVKVNVKLKRQISQHLLTTYLPSSFIIVIAQVICFQQYSNKQE